MANDPTQDFGSWFQSSLGGGATATAEPPSPAPEKFASWFQGTLPPPTALDYAGRAATSLVTGAASGIRQMAAVPRTIDSMIYSAIVPKEKQIPAGPERDALIAKFHPTNYLMGGIEQGAQAVQESGNYQDPVTSSPNGVGKFLATDVASGVGGLVPLMATGMAGGAAGLTSKAAQYGIPAITNGLMSGVAGYEEAMRKGADDKTAFESFAANAGLGAAASAPIGHWLGEINKASGGTLGHAITKMFIEGGANGVAMLLQHVGEDVVAKKLYDPNRDVSMAGALEAGKTGGAVGLIVSALVSGLARGGQRLANEPAQEVSQEVSFSGVFPVQAGEPTGAAASQQPLTTAIPPGEGEGAAAPVSEPLAGQGAGSPFAGGGEPVPASSVEASASPEAHPAIDESHGERADRRLREAALAHAIESDRLAISKAQYERVQPVSLAEARPPEPVPPSPAQIAEQRMEAARADVFQGMAQDKEAVRLAEEYGRAAEPRQDEIRRKLERDAGLPLSDKDLASLAKGEAPPTKFDPEIAFYSKPKAAALEATASQEAPGSPQAEQGPVAGPAPEIAQEAVAGPSKYAAKIAESNAKIEGLMAKLAKQARRARSGLDTDTLATVTQLAAEHIKRGNYKFRAFADPIVASIGEHIRPYLHHAWNAVRASLPESERAHVQEALPLEPPPTAVHVGPDAVAGFDVPEETGWRSFVRHFVNDFDRLEQVEKAAPNKVQAPENVKQAVQTSPGKRFGHSEILDRQILRPMQRVMRSSGIPALESKPGLPSASDYLYALAAPKANATLLAREHVYDGAGMSDPLAAKIIAEAKLSGKQPAYDRIQALNQKHNAMRLDTLESGYLISPETRATWEKNWGPDYVPFKSIHDPTEQIVKGGKGFQVSGPESKQRKGRASLADSPLVTSFASTETAIGRKESNRIGNLLADLAERNPGGPLRVETDANKIKDGEFKLSYKAGGEQRYLVTSDKGLNDAFKRIQTPDAGVLKVLDPINNFLHKVIISRNPTFPFYLFPKHLGTAVGKVAIEQGPKMAAQVAANSLPALHGAWQAIHDETVKGKWPEVYRHARDAGALIGWNNQYNFEDASRNWEQAVQANKPLRVKVKVLTDTIENMIRAADLGPRLATFDAYLKDGKTEAEAAVAARKVSADFARRGSLTPILRRAFMFFGAATQGTAEIGEAIAGHPARASLVLGSMVGLGYVTAALSRSFAKTDEDGNAWDNMTATDKARHVGVMVGDKLIGFPAPFGYNIFPFIGSQLEEAQNGTTPKSKIAADILAQTIDSFSPIHGADLTQALTPTLARPFQEVATNENYSGRPLYPPPDPFAKTQAPDSQASFKSTPQIYKSAAEGLNRITGGDEVKQGAIDVHPGSIQHLAEAAAGALGTNISRTINVVQKIVSGDMENLRVSDFPIVRVFVQQPSPGVALSKYYENVATLAELERQIKEYKAKGMSEQAGQVQQDNAEVLGLSREAKLADAHLKQLKERSKLPTATPGMIEGYDARAKVIREHFNEQFAQARAGGS